MNTGPFTRITNAVSKRVGSLCWASFGLCCLAAAAVYALNNGILLGSRLEIQSRKDIQANKIINDRVMKCRYLYLSGVVERETLGDIELAPCAFMGGG
jgi:hypothetical protein